MGIFKHVKFDTSGEVTVLFGGDTCFGERWQSRRGKKNILKSRGYRSLISAFDGLLADSDLSIVNLETALVNPEFSSPFEGHKKYINPGHPERTCDALLHAGIEGVSLANNHSYDYHFSGLVQTVDALDESGIHHFGAGKNLQQASQPLVYNLGPVHLYVLGCYWVTPGMDNGFRYYTTADGPGVYGIDPNLLQVQIQYIRSFDPKAYVVVFPHWGNNYGWRTERQRELARLMVNAGADLVVGHGAHQLQEVEWYKSKAIVYGLGNFIYGAPGRYRKKKGYPFSMALQVVFDLNKSKVKRFRLFPFYCDNRETDYQPRLATQEEMDGILEHLVQSDEKPGDLKKRLKISERATGLYFQMRPNGQQFSSPKKQSSRFSGKKHTDE